MVTEISCQFLDHRKNVKELGQITSDVEQFSECGTDEKSLPEAHQELSKVVDRKKKHARDESKLPQNEDDCDKR